MKPEYWGPHAWKFLHYVCLNYPDNPTKDDTDAMKNYINSFSEIIPCPTCKSDFKKIIEEYDLNTILESRESLFEWSVDVHNRVNAKLGKRTLSYTQALRLLTHPFVHNTHIRILILLCLLAFLLKR